MAYNTNNPVGSTDPRDLFDNAGNMDKFENGPNPFYPDRFGVQKLSRSGMIENFNNMLAGQEAEFQQFLTDSGFVSLGNYAPGLSFTAYNQYMARGGFFYRPAPSSIPFTTTGTWDGADEDLFVLFSQDDVLRQDLANPDKGAAMVARGVVAVDSIADLLALPEGQRKEGLRYLVKGYHAGSDMGGGEFYWDVDNTKTEDGGTILGSGATGRFVRIFDGGIYVTWFGVVGDQITDDSAAMALAVAYQENSQCKLKVPSKARIKISEPLILPACFNIEGDGAAVQLQPRFVAAGNNAIFTGGSGFSSESGRFVNIGFDSMASGTGTAIYSPDDGGYISQTVFDGCTFYSRLAYGINAPLVLCRFYSCDFGSYPGSYNPFIAIRSIGTIGVYEANVNTFNSCVFRKSSAHRLIHIGPGGVQWRFFTCDFEQNRCAAEIIRNEGAGPIAFDGGYVENNDTPYFVRNYGNLATAFCPVISVNGMHLNEPATIAVLKREIKFPVFEITNSYGKLNCALTQNENGLLNRKEDMALSFGNHFNLIGGGTVGDYSMVTAPGGYNTASWRAKEGHFDSLNAVIKNDVTISIGTPKGVVDLVSSLDSVSSTYNGVLTVRAVAGTLADTTGDINTATYVLAVSKGGISGCSLISATGTVAGEVANHPSFEWTLVGDTLTATQVGLTEGVFSFAISTFGFVRAV